MKVAILGAGPAGLMAAYACERNGLTPEIWALSKTPSEINSDMFLQRPLPDLPGHEAGVPDALIEYVKQGTARGYARKCYGNEDAVVSWENINWGEGGIWWLRDVYELLWERYEGSIRTETIGPIQAGSITGEYNLVLSTVPAPVLCLRPSHSFSSVPTWLVRESQRYLSDRHRNRLIYNGHGEPRWFRYSFLRGIRTWEYSRCPREYDDEQEVLVGKKFTGNSCNCHPRVYRIGRWAMWKRGVLNHHAFEQTTAILASAGLGKVA